VPVVQVPASIGLQGTGAAPPVPPDDADDEVLPELLELLEAVECPPPPLEDVDDAPLPHATAKESEHERTRARCVVRMRWPSPKDGSPSYTSPALSLTAFGWRRAPD
jgi:hypothetical protein